MRNYRGTWRLSTAPATEPVTLTEAKDHLRLDTGTMADRTASTQSIAPGAHVIAAAFSLEGAGVAVTGRDVLVYLSSATNGVGGTVDIKLQDSADDITYADVSSGAFTQVTEANDNATYEKAYSGTAAYLRVVSTVAVATCDFGVSITTEEPATTAEDTNITTLITTARMAVEEHLSRALITQSWTLTLGEWGTEILLPRPRTSAVTEILYTDTDGVQQTLAADQYTLLDQEEPARVVPAFNITWPTLYDIPNPVSVEYVSGYGAASAVPEPIKHGMLLWIGQLYENREPVVIGTTAAKIPLTLDALLATYVVHT